MSTTATRPATSVKPSEITRPTMVWHFSSEGEFTGAAWTLND